MDFKSKTRLYSVTIVLLALVFIGIMPWIINNVYRTSVDLSSKVIDNAAKEEANRTANALKTIRGEYTNDVIGIASDYLKITHDFDDPKWDTATVKAIPLPATLSMNIAKEMSNKGTKVDLYSKYPFPWRAKGGVNERTLTDFQSRAWDYFVKHHDGETSSDLEFYEFDREKNVLNYAIPDLMQGMVCVECHNTVADSPKIDWKLGDVRGTISIKLPLNRTQKINVGIDKFTNEITTFLILMGVIAMMIFVLVFFNNKEQKIKIISTAKDSLLQEEINDALEQRVQEMTHELTRKNETLERRNLELEQFAHVASHDLQEPLKTVTNYIGLLQEKKGNKIGKDGNLFVNFALKATIRMKSLINDILKYSMAGQVEQLDETIDINALIDDLINDNAASITENNVTITHAELIGIKGNKTLLKQLFQNLISNSIKYRLEGVDPVIKIHSTKQGTSIKFTVEDNGIGIEKQYFDRIFSVFQRLHAQSQYEGTGIGLAYCKKIVEVHGGEIWVESELNKGSKFIFTIPYQAIK
ncbi:MAG: DUF3365 domain-containing protein [Crocinitomicaceae bacterium]|nr:DUF3365 domain-containing protein [Crocinitomicaceae bacterium]